MSLVEDTPQENVQEESEECVHEHDTSKESDQNAHRDKDVEVKGHLKTNQREKRTISPLTLLKEDFSHFREEVLKVFKDKDMRTENEDKPTSSTFSLLREDLSQLKEDMTNIFNVKSSKDRDPKSTDPKTDQSAERTINPLSLLKEDLSNVFRLSLSKEKDNKVLAGKEDCSKIKDLRVLRTDDPFRDMFRRDQKLLKTSEDSQGFKTTLSEKSEDLMDIGFRGYLSGGTFNAEKMDILKDRMTESHDSKEDIDVFHKKSEMTTSLSETEQSCETICTSQAADRRCGLDYSSVVSGEDQRRKEEREDEPSETLPWKTLVSGTSLFSLTDAKKDTRRDQLAGDLWLVKNFACYLTFDPSTANSELHLTNNNRRVTRVWSDRRSSDHPDRFERCPQVLCREGLLDSVYWEVEWSGGADIGVTYNSISRDGDTASCLLGHNERSWSLECSKGTYTPCYNSKRFRSSSPEPFTHRVGVYLNWSAGSLSFYCVSQATMVHLHTFTSTFTEPLYPGFWVWAYDGSVSLCQVEFDWERLLQ